MTKYCRKCSSWKSVDEFHKRASSRNGRQSRCKTCVSADGAARYATHRESIQARSRAYNRARRAESPLWGRLRFGRDMAAKAGLPVETITPDQLLADWQRRGIDPTRCVYTGEPLRDDWHLDHAVPLSYADSPGHVVANLVPANSNINRSKKSRHWIDFLADRAEASRG